MREVTLRLPDNYFQYINGVIKAPFLKEHPQFTLTNARWVVKNLKKFKRLWNKTANVYVDGWSKIFKKL